MENWWSLFTIIGDNQRNPLGIYEKAGAVQYKHDLEWKKNFKSTKFADVWGT